MPDDRERERAGGRPSWRLAEAGIVLRECVQVSFQRCESPADGVHRASPRSLGLLRARADASGNLLLPMAAGESVWLGLSLMPGQRHGALRAAVLLAGGHVLNVVSGRPWDVDSRSACTVSTWAVIDGIRRDAETVWALQRVSPQHDAPLCRELRLSGGADELSPAAAWDVAIHAVDYATYSNRCDCPAPDELDPDAGYKGHRMP